jgi:hypothetical protein
VDDPKDFSTQFAQTPGKFVDWIKQLKDTDRIALWSMVGALSSSVIAIAALGLSIWSGLETREHDHLSVKPLICPRYGDNGDIEVVNKGIGPAIMRDEQIFVGTNLMPFGPQGYDATVMALGLPPKSVVIHYWENGNAIAANEEPTILFGMNQATKPDLFRKAASVIRFQFTSESIYGDERQYLSVSRPSDYNR